MSAKGNLDIAVGVAVQQQLLADLCGQELEDCQVGGRQLSHQAVMAADLHTRIGQHLIQLLDQCADLHRLKLLTLTNRCCDDLACFEGRMMNRCLTGLAQPGVQYGYQMLYWSGTKGCSMIH